MKTLSLLICSLCCAQLTFATSSNCDNVTDPGKIYHNLPSEALVKFCDAWQPAPIGETETASGGSGGPIGYQWQYKLSDENWHDITISEGENNSLNLSHPNIIQFFNNNGVLTSQTVSFRRGARRPDCTNFLYSNEVRYQVYPNVGDDHPPIEAGVFCDYNAAQHCLSIGSGSATDTYEYLWRFSYDNENWIHTSTEMPTDYCYPSGTTAYLSVGSRLIGSSCDYIFKPSLEIITHKTPSLDVAVEPVSCAGENDGELSVSDVSGNSSTLTNLYSYSINNGQDWQSSPNFTDLTEGAYTIEVQTAYCGTYSTSSSLEASPSPVLEDLDIEPESDCGSQDGSISISLSGGTGQFEYRLSTTSWQSSPSFNNLAVGSYDLYGRNTDGSCQTFLGEANVPGPISPQLSNIGHADPSDCGVNDGEIHIEADGGQGSLSYTIDGGNNWSISPSFMDLPADEYLVGVRNQDGSCEIYTSLTLEAPEAPIIEDVSSQNPSDCGSDNGQITIQANGLGSPLEYSIDGGDNWSNQSNFDGLSAGFYEVQIRKTDGTCTVSHPTTVELSAPSSPEANAIEVDQPSDCQVDDGEIRIYPSSSQWHYSIDGGNSWQEGSGIFTDLAPGTYEPYIKNADGTCPTSAGAAIALTYPNQPSILSIDYGNPSDWCITDGYLSISASGGQSPLEYTRNGIVWQSSPEFTSLGTATLTPGVRNADGSCETFSPETILIDYPARPDITQVTETADSGCGADDGSILIEVTNGIGEFDYSIDNGNSWQNTPLFEGLPSSNYAIAVKNQGGTCEVTEDIYVPELLKPRITDINIQGPSDCGLSDASISLAGDRGTGSYQFTIDAGQSWSSNAIFEDLAPGNYQLGIRNANGYCEVYESEATTINEHPHKIITDLEIQQPSDCDIDDGEVRLSVQGNGVSEYSIDGGQSWQSSRTFSDLAPGTYQPAVRNTDGTCFKLYEEDFSLHYPPRPIFDDVIPTSTSDCNVADGSIEIIGGAGTGSFQYSINDGNSWQNDQIFHGLGAATYGKLAIRNSDGTCIEEYQGNVAVLEPPKPTFGDLEVDQPSDCNVDDGSIIITANNGIGDYEYTFDGGDSWQQQHDLGNLAPGSYLTGIRNNDGTCPIFKNNPTDLDYPPEPSIADIAFDQPSDCNTNDGSINIQAANGTGNFQYSINGGSSWESNGNFNNLQPGDYQIAVRNSNGTCSITDNQTIELAYPPEPSIADIAFDQPSDCNTNDGAINIQAADGTGNFQYSINGGSSWESNGNFNNLQPGDYQIAVRNSNGTCSITDNQAIELAYPPEPSIANIAFDQPSDCNTNDGSINIQAAEGTGNFQYSIDGGSSWESNGNFNNLQPGDYQIAIRNSNGTCLVTDNQTIELAYPPEPSIADIAFDQPSDCNTDDGSISIQAADGTGNFQYSIDGGSSWENNSNFNNLQPGDYQIAVRNNNGTCLVTDNQAIELAYPPEPAIADIAFDQPSDCNTNDGSISIQAADGTGNFQYSIDGGSSWESNGNFNNLPPGNYQIAVRNSNGTCSITDNQTIELAYPPEPSIADIAFDQPSDCNTDDGSINIQAADGTGNFQYSINGGSSWENNSNFNNLQPGDYQIAIRNSNGTCSITDNQTIELAYPPEPSIADIAFDQPSDCNTDDGSISIQAADGTGNFQYSIDGGSSWESNGNFNNLQPGDYQIAIRNSNGTCLVTDNQTIELAYPPEPSITDIAFDQPSDCNTDDGVINIQAADGTGNFQYSIDGGSSWESNSNFNNLQPGDYQIAIRNSNGTCLVTDNQTIELVYPPEPSIADIAFGQPSDCNTDDGVINIQAADGTGNFQYSIDGGSSWENNSNFNNLQPGDYQIAIRNSNGTCLVTDNQAIELAYPPEPSIADIAFDQPSDCNTDDGSISIQAADGTGNFQYSIDGGNSWESNSNFNNLQPGDYQIAIRNSNGTCLVTDNQTIELAYPPEPSIADIAFDQPSDCNTDDGVINIQAADGTGNFQYSIDGGNSWESNGSFNNLQPGDYEIAIRNSNGTCSITDNQTIELAYPPEPSIADIAFDQPSDCNTNDGAINIQAADGTGNFQYSIDGGSSWESNGSFNNLQPGDYQIAIRNSNGTCSITDNQTIELAYPPEPSIADIAFDQPSDCNTDDGSISIQAADGTGNFQYSINGGSSWESNSNFNNLQPGDYQIAIRNSNGTCLVTDNQTIELAYPPEPSIADIAFDQPSDCNTNDGSISIQAADGTGNFQYSINGGNSWESNSNFNNLQPGDYQIAIRNSNGTCLVTDNQTIELAYPPEPSIADIAFDQPSDCEIDDGSITITGANGIGSYSFSINGGNTWTSTNTFNNLGPGNYPIALSNADGTCEVASSTDVQITYPEAPEVLQVITESPAGCGSADGVIEITASGGEGTVEYSINNGDTWQNHHTFTNLPPGVYSIRIRNQNQTCEQIYGEVQLNAPSSPAFSNVDTSDPIDCGSASGQINILANGGSGSYQFSINGGESWSDNGLFTGLSAGNYTPSIRNSDGTCQVDYQGTLELQEPEPAHINSIDVDQPSDCEVNDGSLQINIDQDSNNFQFSIDGGNTWQNSPLFTNLSPGNYQVGVRRSNGQCEIINPQNIQLQYPLAPEIISINAQDISDCGLQDGEIQIAAQGGIGNFEYSIDNGQSWFADNRFSNLAPGVYEIAVRNRDQSCPVFASAPTRLVEPTAPTIQGVDIGHPSDCGSPDGQIQIYVDDESTSNLQFSIDSGDSWQSNAIFSDLPAASYQIGVRNADGTCEFIQSTSIELQDPIPPTIQSVVHDNPSNCEDSDGSIYIQLIDSDTDKLFSIDGGQSWQASPHFDGLPAGNYLVSVSNQEGTCEVAYTDHIQLLAPAAPSLLSVEVEPVTDCDLFDAKIEINASSGSGSISYSIDNGLHWSANPVFTNLSPGVYQVVVSNDNGVCPVNHAEAIMIDPLISPEILQVYLDSPTDCGKSDGKLEIEAVGSSQSLLYSIDDGLSWKNNPLFEDLPPGQYRIRIKYANGTCEVALPQAVTISAPEAPSIIDILANSSSSCETPTGSIQIATFPTQGLEYSVDGGYSWSSSPTFDALAPGQYQVSIRNNDGTCQVDALQTINISAPSAPQLLEIIIGQPSACGSTDGSIEIVAEGQGELLYSINDGATWVDQATFTNLTPGQYNIGIQNADGGCVFMAEQAVLIIPPSAPELIDVQFQPISDCGLSNGQITVEATGDKVVQYSIDNGQNWQISPQFDGLPMGQYSISLQYIDGSCAVNNVETIEITAPSPPEILAVSTSSTIDCSDTGAVIQISADGGDDDLLYSIDGGQSWHTDSMFSNLGAGDYAISIRFANGSCQVDASENISIIAPEAPQITDILVDQASGCETNDAQIAILADGGQDLQYSIDGGLSWANDPTFNNLGSGEYAISIRYANGSCQVDANESTSIIAPEAPQITDILVDQASGCETNDAQIAILADGGQDLQYSIDGGLSWANDPTFNNLGAGDYAISIRFANGSCQVDASQSTSIIAPEAPQITDILIDQPAGCDSSNAQISILTDSEQDLQYSIDGGLSWANDPTFSNLGSGDYAISIRYANGSCQVDASQSISIIAPEAPQITDILVEQAAGCETNDAQIAILADSEQNLQYSIDGGLSWANDPTFSNLGAGDYSISIRYANGSCQVDASESISIIAPEAPQISDILVDQLAGCDSSNAQISILTDSTQDLQYSIDGGLSWANDPTFNNLGASVYAISIRFANGSCQVDASESTSIIAPEAPQISDILVDQLADCDSSNAQISILTDSTQDLQYSIDGGLSWANDPTFNNLGAGDYAISIRYTNGSCQVDASESISIIAPEAPQISDILVDQLADCDSSNAQISILTDSTQDLQYSIDGGLSWANDPTFNNLGAGDYAISIRYTNGSCQVDASESISIIAPEAPQISDILVDQLAGCDSSNAQISILTDSAQDLQYSIDGGLSWANDSTFNNLGAGVYAISIRFANGSCQVDASESISIIASEAPQITDVLVDQPAACEVTGGGITILAENSAQLEFSIDDGNSWQVSPHFSGLSPGIYAVLARDTLSTCQGPLSSFEIEAGIAPQIGHVGLILPSDCSVDDGGIFINPADSNLLYSIDGGLHWQNNYQFDGLGPGTYFVSISSPDSLCQTEYEIPVRLATQNAATIWQVDASLPSSCGKADATLQIMILEEETLFEFSINNGESWQDSSSYVGLSSGTYQVKVRHKELGCISVYHPPIVIPDPPGYHNLMIEEQLPSYCGAEDGSILINYATTTASVEAYSIDGGNTWQESSFFHELGGGLYEVRIRLADETCELIHLYPINLSFVSSADSLQIQTQAITDCQGEDGMITIHSPVPGNYEYSIDRGFTYQPSPTFERLTAGSYFVRMRDLANSCEYEHPLPIQIQQISPPSIANVHSAAPSGCSADGMIQISAVPSTQALLYSIDAGASWQNDSLFNQLPPGEYQVMIRYASGACPVSYPEVIVFSDSTTSSFTEVNWEQSLCPGESIQIGDSLITQAGNYQIHIQHESACDSLVNLRVVSSEIPITEMTATICQGEVYQVGQESFASPGIFEIRLQSAHGCDSIINLNLQVNQSDTTYFSIDLCEGESFQYEDRTLIDPGRYTFVHQGAISCDSLVIVDLEFTPGPVSWPWEVTPPSSCEASDGSIQISNGSPLLLYSIDNGLSWQNQGWFQELSNGNYSLLIRDIQTNCALTEEIPVFSHSIPQLDSILVDPGLACQGPNGRITFQMLDTTEAYLFSINGGQSWQPETSYANLHSGVYDLQISQSDSSCAYQVDQVQILASDSLVADVLAVDHDFCHSDSSGVIGIYVMQGSSPYTYHWSNGNDLPEIDQLSPGEYTITITDNKGCQDSLRIDLEAYGASTLPDSLLQDTFFLCKGEVLELALEDETLPYKWTGTNGFLAEGHVVEISEEGQYSLVVQTLDGCAVSDSFLVIQGNDHFNANFLLPTSGLINTSVFAVEVSWPIPEQVHWIADQDQVSQLSTYLNQTEWQFQEEGTFAIGMEAQLGDCLQYVEKWITIYSDPDSIPSQSQPTTRGSILAFSLFPNPNNGNFELLAEFTETQTGQMRIYNDSGLLLEARDLNGWSSYRENFQLPNAPPGNYIAILQTEFDYRTLNFVIQR